MLVVDDDAMVRALVGEMLREMGFDVREAASAKQALAMLQTGCAVTTVITDIRMPEVSGLELAVAVRRAHPGVRIVYMTGYAKEAASGHSQFLAHDVLIKPFTFEQLETVMCNEKPRSH